MALTLSPVSPIGLMADYLVRDLGKIVENSSDHKGVRVIFQHSLADDTYIVGCECHACQRVWSQRLTAAFIARSSSDFAALVRQELVKFFKFVSLEECFSIVSAAELAEWITQQLASAGAEGVRYADLCQRAAEGNKATPKGTDTMLRRMGFLEEWTPVRPILPAQVAHYAELGGELVNNPAIVLPEGHPRRSW